MKERQHLQIMRLKETLNSIIDPLEQHLRYIFRPFRDHKINDFHASNEYG